METVIDYYPFGAEHHNPEISTQPKPRYRYSGKEEAESYYQYSPYTYCANNPTNLIDPDGERVFATFFDGESWIDYEFVFGFYGWEFINTNNGLAYGNDGTQNYFIDDLIWTLRNIMSFPHGYYYINELVSMEEAVVIQFSSFVSSLNCYIPYEGTETSYQRVLSDINNDPIVPIGAINWCNPAEVTPERKYRLGVMTEYGREINTLATLVHELAHFYYHAKKGINASWFMIDEGKKMDINLSEIYTTHVENIIRTEQGYNIRIRYLSGYVDKYNGIDVLINLKNKSSLYYNSDSNIYDIYMNFDNINSNGFKY